MTKESAIEQNHTWAVRSPVRFGAAMVGVMFGLKVLVLPLAIAVGGGDTSGPILKGGLALVLVSFALLPVETLIGQAMPLWLLTKLGVRRRFVLCALSGTFFGLLHMHAGPGSVVVTSTSAMVLSYCWLSWRVKSRGAAFWLTTAVHATHNALSFILYTVGDALT